MGIIIGITIVLIYNMYAKSTILDQLAIQRREIMADLTALKEAVSEIDSTGDAVIEMLNGIAAQLEAANGDQAEIDAIAAQIRQQTDDFAAAVEANTPVEQEVPEHPEPADDEPVIVDEPVEDNADPNAEPATDEEGNDVLYGEETPEEQQMVSDLHDTGVAVPADEVDSDEANNAG